MITQDYLKERLYYDKETGIFTWLKSSITRPDLVGKVAGSKSVKDGYIRIFINMKSYLAHRLAFIYVNGNVQKIDVDHINGDRSDNRMANLREATRSVNIQNLKKAKSDNKSSGLLGACYDAKAGKYRSAITLDGMRKHLGYYDTAEKAHSVYLDAKRILHEGCTI